MLLDTLRFYQCGFRSLESIEPAFKEISLGGVTHAVLDLTLGVDGFEFLCGKLLTDKPALTDLHLGALRLVATELSTVSSLEALPTEMSPPWAMEDIDDAAALERVRDCLAALIKSCATTLRTLSLPPLPMEWSFLRRIPLPELCELYLPRVPFARSVDILDDVATAAPKLQTVVLHRIPDEPPRRAPQSTSERVSLKSLVSEAESEERDAAACKMKRFDELRKQYAGRVTVEVLEPSLAALRRSVPVRVGELPYWQAPRPVSEDGWVDHGDLGRFQVIAGPFRVQGPGFCVGPLKHTEKELDEFLARVGTGMLPGGKW